MRQKISFEQTKLRQEKRDKELVEKYHNSWMSKVERPFRILFFIQVCLVLCGFFFSPFKSLEVIDKYNYSVSTIRRGGKFYYGNIKTISGENIQVTSVRLQNAQITAGDSIYILRNIFYKTEGITHLKSNKTYFNMKMWVWSFIWLFFLSTAVASAYFKAPQDLFIKARISIILFILFLAYIMF